MTTIAVQNLAVFSGSTRLLGPVSFQVAAGGTLIIMGETGAGKSLIAQAILGTLPKSLHAEGVIEINQQRVDTLDAGRRAALWGREIATLPQEPWRALDPLMASWKQVAETHCHVSELSMAQARIETEKDLIALGLNGVEPRLPGQLSGGMAQRVAFAAATAGRAPILLADEPTKGLDADRQDRVIRLLAKIPRTGGTLLAITHEAAVATALGGDMIVLRDGNVVEQGKVTDVLHQPQARYTKELLAADPGNWRKFKPSAPGDIVLTAKDLAVSRGDRTLIKGFNLTLRAGERIAISGPSGAGKTSLLDTLAQLTKPAQGWVEPARSLSRHAVQKLYQDPPAAFPPHITLGTNLRDVARLHRVAWDNVAGYMKDLGLHSALLDRRPDAVSGGELQRISIARALTVSPKVLLADEPTSRLDPISQRNTLELLANMGRTKEIAIILITHNSDIAECWADRSIAVSPPTRGHPS